ncbi:MAG: metalloregulator ArsR/SmtB family transcription factor [Tagaea sp.]|nr:metalloregulator ArsR/SmtB family transcription factor [Tagaea sp.]
MTATLDTVLDGLRAVAEPTRLRLLALCAQGELTVSELVQILGQSQPRVSRHLKLLCEAGLLARLPEGGWVFYRLAEGGGRANGLVRRLADLIPHDDALLARDRERLTAVRAGRAERAAAYFRANAENWDRIRALHIDDAEVEKRLLTLLPPARVTGELLDIGTGTGRVLEVFGKRGVKGVGVDMSLDMLRVARANLAKAGLAEAHVRQADMYRLPFEPGAFAAVVFHQVLHFADDPAAAIAEAARVLAPGGRLVAVDFAPHELDELRARHAHRRLGFADSEMRAWLRAAKLAPAEPIALPGKPLTVCLWAADRPNA